MPIPAGGGGGSVLTQHQSSDTETDGQRKTRDGSSYQPGALLQISYFTDEFTVHNILQYYFGTGEDDGYPGSIPGDTSRTNYFKLFISLLCVVYISKIT